MRRDASQTDVVLPQENASQTALERIPKDESGEPKYEAVDAGTAWDAILEQMEGDEGMAESVVKSMVEDKKRALEDAEKSKVKAGGTIGDKIRAEKERQAVIDEAKGVLAKWEEIAAERGKRANAPKEKVTPMGEGDGVAKGDVAPKGEDAAEEKAAKVGEVEAKGGKAEDKEVDEAAKEGAAKEETMPKVEAEEEKSGPKVDETTEEVVAKEGTSEGNTILKGEEDGGKVVVDEDGKKEKIAPIGRGVFGDIYDQFKGRVKEAIAFLKSIGGGETLAALHHKDVGDIALVWGNDKAGLKKILRKHPEVVDNLQELIDGMRVVSSSDNRIVLESDTHKAVVSKKLGNKETEQWLLTAYEKKNAAKGGSSDIGPKPQTDGGKQNGTAPLQNGTSSEDKGTKNNDALQGGSGYSITPAEYVTRRGKVLDMRFVTFDDIDKETRDRGIRLAEKWNGWYDWKKGGFMMRSEEDAKLLVERLTGKRVDEVEGEKAKAENGKEEGKAVDSAKVEGDAKVEKPKNSGEFGLVSDERMEELRKRMREKLAQLNLGIDPELLAIGAELTVGYFDRGVRRFADYAKRMVEDLGDGIRPYLKGLYEYVRKDEDVVRLGIDKSMSSYEDVDAFDVANFDKATNNVIENAKERANEQKVKGEMTEEKKKEAEGIRKRERVEEKKRVEEAKDKEVEPKKKGEKKPIDEVMNDFYDHIVDEEALKEAEFGELIDDSFLMNIIDMLNGGDVWT